MSGIKLHIILLIFTVLFETLECGDVQHITSRDSIFPSLCGYKEANIKFMLENEQQVQRRSKRVINGSPTIISTQPWQVAIVDKRNDLKCGGSIITKKHVLTAARCFVITIINSVNGQIVNAMVNQTDRRIIVGNTRFAESSLEYDINKLRIHQAYNISHHRNDIALIEIFGEFSWTERVFPICLPTKQEPYTIGRECVISGFGDDSQLSDGIGLLQFGRVKILRNQECINHKESKKYQMANGMFCAAGLNRNNKTIDGCKGDLGGPLSCPFDHERERNVLLGITSFGHRCGRKGYAMAYTKVSKYIQWIDYHILDTSKSGVNRPANLEKDFTGLLVPN